MGVGYTDMYFGYVAMIVVAAIIVLLITLFADR